MAILGATYSTLADYSKMTDDTGSVNAVIEVLNSAHPILQIAPLVEGNQTDGHKTTIRSKLPEAMLTSLYEGVKASKSGETQIVDKMGMIEAMSDVDTRLAKLNGKVNEYRAAKSIPYIEAMSQEFERIFWYGNSKTNPKEFHGITARYNKLSNDKKDPGYNVFDAGGTGSDNTSIWLVGFGPGKTQLFYPKGQGPNEGEEMMGIGHIDRGEESATDDAGGVYYVFRDMFNLKLGLTIEDWRANCRIANIDVSDVEAASVDDNGVYTGPRLFQFMTRAINRVKATTKRNTDGNYTERLAFFMTESTLNVLDFEKNYHPAAGFSFNEVEGEYPASFRNVPIFLTDSILETEERVTA